MAQQITSGRVPPYGPYEAFKQVLMDMADSVVPRRLDSSYWGSAKSGSSQAALNSAFKFFDLVNDDKSATSHLDEFVNAFKAGQKSALADLIYLKYRDAIEKVDLASATSGQLREAFKTAYSIDGDVLKKAVRFFVHAASDAGKTLSPYITNSTRGTGRTTSRPRARAQRSRTAATPAAVASTPLPSEEESFEMLSDLRREYVKTLMEKAFANGEPNAELLDRIERLLGYDETGTK